MLRLLLPPKLHSTVKFQSSREAGNENGAKQVEKPEGLVCAPASPKSQLQEQQIGFTTVSN